MARYSTDAVKRRREQREVRREEQQRKRQRRKRERERQQVTPGGGGDEIKRRPRRRAAAPRLPLLDAAAVELSDSDQTEIDEQEHSTAAAAPGAQVRQQNPFGFAGLQHQAVADSADRFYVIESLLDKRYDLEGNEEYLVRWQNYPPEYDSWEPRAELELNSLDMIHEFNRIPLLSKRDEPERHCVCRRPYRFDQGGMILCDKCRNWYHFSCLRMNMVEANSYAKYNCQRCRQLNPNLKNVIKREKVNSLYGNTPLVDIESAVAPAEDEPFTV